LHPSRSSACTISAMRLRAERDSGTALSLSKRQPALPKYLIARGVLKH
jgi:hypothetical protein